MGGETPGAAERLAELVAARLCHDLSGPLSIIANAAEVARLEGGREGGEAMALMLEGGRGIADRVKLLRALFGPPVGPLSAGDVGALTRGTLGGGRALVDLSAIPANSVFPPAAARALLAALAVAAEALPRGGTIRCHGGAEDFAVAIEGAGARWPEHLTAVLAGAEPVAAAVEGGARGLMGPWLVLAARAAGLAPALLMGGGVPLLRLARPQA
jgi:histidine phosphotransferase ChpT